MSVNDSQWTTVIEGNDGRFRLNFKDLWDYRDLIKLFIRRDFVANYKQTVLGPLWFLVQPIISTVVFTIVFGNIAKIPTDGLPQVVFYMAGIIVWNYFSTCLNKNATTFIDNKNIFGKVYFPRLSVPIANIITNFLAFLIQFALFLAITSYFYLKGSAINPNWWILLTPFLLLQTGVLGLGIGILISSLTTRYKDLTFLVSFGVQLWMYATPIVYPLSQIPAKWQWLYAFNPMSVIIEIFRYAFLGAGAIKLWQLGISLGMTLIVLTIALMLFTRVEKTFMDTI